MNRCPRSARALLGAGLLLLLPAAAAKAAPICPPNVPGTGSFLVCFDDVPSLSAASAASLPGVAVNDATVFSEAHAALALGFVTDDWTTSGDQGLLNSLVPVVSFHFDTRVASLSIDVVELPGTSGSDAPVALHAFRNGVLVDALVSSASGVPVTDSDALRLALATTGGVDRIDLFVAADDCTGADCLVDPAGNFFADTLQFQVPEPRGLALAVCTGIMMLGVRRRAR